MTIAFLGSLGALLSGGIGRAQAQGNIACPEPIPGPGTTVVSAEAQFNEAIACYNQATIAGSYVITIAGPIQVSGQFVASNGEVSDSLPITQAGAGFDLEIGGGELEGGGSSTFDGDAALLVAGTGGAPVKIANTQITGGFFAIRANDAEVHVDNVVFDSNHFGLFAATSTVRIDDSTFRGNSGPAVAVSTQSMLTVGRTRIVANSGVGITSTDSTVSIEDSIVSQNDGGVNVASGPFTMVNSTVERSARGSSVNLLFSVAEIRSSTVANNGNIGVNAAGATVLISNSTIAGNVGLGIRLDDLAPTLVVNSTVADNGLGAFTAFNSQLTAVSSFMNGCPIGEVAVDGGGNAGTCFGADRDLGPLTSNGCAIEQAKPEGFGCGETRALPPGSSAISAGDCSAAVLVDQRGVARTPVDRGCDSGAYEAGTYELTIDKAVVGAPPTEDWSFSIAALERCFPADPASTTQAVEVTASGGSASIEVYEDCEVTVTEESLDGFEAEISEQTVIVDQDQLLSFRNTQLPAEQNLTISTIARGGPGAATFVITPSTGCVVAPDVVELAGAGQAVVVVADIAATTAAACSYGVNASAPAGYGIAPVSETVTALQDWRADFVVTQLPQRAVIMVAVDAANVSLAAPVTVSINPDPGCSAEPAEVTLDAPGQVEVAVTDVAETTAEICNYSVSAAVTGGYSIAPTQPQIVAAGGSATFSMMADPTPTPTPTSSPTATSTPIPRVAPVFRGTHAGVGISATTVPAPAVSPSLLPVASVPANPNLAVTGSTVLLPITIGLASATLGVALLLATRRRKHGW